MEGRPPGKAEVRPPAEAPLAADEAGSGTPGKGEEKAPPVVVDGRGPPGKPEEMVEDGKGGPPGKADEMGPGPPLVVAREPGKAEEMGPGPAAVEEGRGPGGPPRLPIGPPMPTSGSICHTTKK